MPAQPFYSERPTKLSRDPATPTPDGATAPNTSTNIPAAAPRCYPSSATPQHSQCAVRCPQRPSSKRNLVLHDCDSSHTFCEPSQPRCIGRMHILTSVPHATCATCPVPSVAENAPSTRAARHTICPHHTRAPAGLQDDAAVSIPTPIATRPGREARCAAPPPSTQPHPPLQRPSLQPSSNATRRGD